MLRGPYKSLFLYGLKNIFPFLLGDHPQAPTPLGGGTLRLSFKWKSYTDTLGTPLIKHSYANVYGHWKINLEIIPHKPLYLPNKRLSRFRPIFIIIQMI